MSTSSVRRIKERGGGGGIVKAAAPALTTAAKSFRSITPVSERSISGGGDSLKRSTGKENPRPSSRIRAAAAAKPVIRPMPRIDKALACAVGNAETRLRWSTSSVPRGRSSSPSEFSRDLSDLRKTRVSRVSEVDRNRASERVQEKKSAFRDSRCENGTRAVERVQEKKAAFNVKSNEKREIGIRGLKESKGLIRNVVGLEESSELYKELESKSGGTKDSRVMVLGDRNGEVNLSTTSKKSSSENSNSISNLDCSKLVLDGTQGSEESKGRCSGRLRSNEAAEKSVNGVNVGAKELGRKSLNRSSGSEISKEKVASEGVSGSAMKKYPSRLHEKLAFLEGKVKRIASDIKRTKEILDMNNPDASKVILTDIHEKISGIEKVMGHVVDGAETKMVVADHGGDDNQQINLVEKSQKDVGVHTKSLVKGLNTEELEERLFPHHKLLKDRTSLKTSVGGLQSSSQSHDPKLVENASESTSKLEKLLSPIDENPIALEFLASLKEEQSKVTRRGENVGLEYCDVQEMDGDVNSAAQDSSNINNREESIELMLTTSETLEEFDDQENRPSMVIEEESEDSCLYQLNEVGHKTTTGGWFVSEGESVLLAHDDGSCSFYDIAHCEEKAEYRPPVGISPNVWRDCWIIRAPGPDGCSGKYVVAASAGNTMDSGFCSWDFYTKDVRAIHIEDGTTNTRTALAPLPNNTVYRRNALSTIMAPENRQWWYKPSGPLIISTASCQRVVKVYDIRDGEHIMKWEVQKPVLAMDYSSPLQWRNRGKVVVAEAENISLWDVNSLNPQPLLSISSSSRKISALHVNNTDAEMGGGVRQRVSSSEAEGNDGVFCTPDSINVLDFRHPSGVGLKIPKLGVNAQSVFSRGDSIFLGCTNLKSSIKNQSSSQLQQFSLRKQRIVSTYTLPESNAHSHYTTITQVWGNSNLVMGVCGLGLFVFDAFDDQLQSCTSYGNMQKVREVIGSDDLYSPSFDYLCSRVLLISRDRPALWRYLS